MSRLPWSAMTDAQRWDLVGPMLETMSYQQVAYRVGAPSRNAISGLRNRIRKGVPSETVKPRKPHHAQPNPHQGGGNGPALPVEAATDMPGAGASRPILSEKPATPSRQVTAPRRSTSSPSAGGISPLSRPWTALSPREKDEAVRARVLAGKSWGQIADELSMTSRNTVAGIVARLRKRGEIPQARSREETGADGAATARLRTASKAHPLTIANNIESRKVDPGVPITISRAAAFDPLPDTTPVPYGSGGCKFPVDGWEGRGHLWCGADKDPLHSYCPAHRRLAFTPVQKRAA